MKAHTYRKNKRPFRCSTRDAGQYAKITCTFRN